MVIEVPDDLNLEQLTVVAAAVRAGGRFRAGGNGRWLGNARACEPASALIETRQRSISPEQHQL